MEGGKGHTKGEEGEETSAGERGWLVGSFAARGVCELTALELRRNGRWRGQSRSWKSQPDALIVMSKQASLQQNKTSLFVGSFKVQGSSPRSHGSKDRVQPSGT